MQPFLEEIRQEMMTTLPVAQEVDSLLSRVKR